MAYPSDLPTVTVRHRIVGTDGTPARGGGRVTAVLTGRLWTGQGSVVPTQYTATVQEDGTYELVLPPVDHPDIVAGRGEAYLVTEPAATIDTRRPGRVATEQFHVAPVTEMVGQTVDVSDVLVTKPKPGGGVERVTITGPATDESLAGIIADPSSQTAASLKDTIGTGVAEVVPGKVAEAIAADDTVVQAAAAAVNAEVETKDLVTAQALATRSPLRGVRWIPLGDSHSSETGGGAGRAGLAPQVTIATDGHVSLVYNAGIPGNTSAQILARLQTDVLDRHPNLVTLWAGTNDISSGRSLTDYQADMTEILDRLNAAGTTVVLFTIPPRSDNTTHNATTAAWNVWLRVLARDRGIDMLDVHALLTDPATGSLPAQYDADGIHLTQAAYKVLADAFAARISPRLPAGGALRPTSNVDPTNLLVNGLMLSASNGVPTGWANTGATTGVTRAIVDDEGFLGGKAYEVALVNPNTFAQTAQNIDTGWSVGDWLLFTLRLKVISSDVSRTAGIRLNANFFGATSPTVIMADRLSVPGINGLITYQVQVPPGTTGPVQLAVIGMPGTTGSITYRIGECAVFNLTTGDAL